MTQSDSPPEQDPAGVATATDVLDEMRRSGITQSFSPGTEPSTLKCGSCGEESPAGDFDVIDEHRLEGASDPDDMVLVVGATCPRCRADGAIVVGFGPLASDADSDIVQALSR